MTRTELLAGARHWWLMDKAEDLYLTAWYVLIAGAVVIAGGPIWLAGLALLPPLVIIAVGIWQRSRAVRESIGFYEWWYEANRDLIDDAD